MDLESSTHGYKYLRFSIKIHTRRVGCCGHLQELKIVVVIPQWNILLYRGSSSIPTILFVIYTSHMKFSPNCHV